MTDNALNEEHALESHAGPIKTPKQLLITVIASFVVPVFIIIGLVAYVVSENKPAGSSQAEQHSLGGMTAQDVDRGVAERIRKVGTVEIRDANRPLKAGEEVVKAQCAACHTTGAAGAPKAGDAAAWGPRVAKGLAALVESALKGKGAMPAQAGGDFDDTEIARAVVHMANQSGAKFAEPQRAAAAVAANAAPAAAQTAAAGAGANAGEALYKQACVVCHGAGVAGAPKLDDKAAWAPRIKTGVDALVQSVIKGKGAMPPKGGSSASDAEIRAAVQFMVNTAK